MTEKVNEMIKNEKDKSFTDRIKKKKKKNSETYFEKIKTKDK